MSARPRIYRQVMFTRQQRAAAKEDKLPMMAIAVDTSMSEAPGSYLCMTGPVSKEQGERILRLIRRLIQDPEAFFDPGES